MADAGFLKGVGGGGGGLGDGGGSNLGPPGSAPGIYCKLKVRFWNNSIVGILMTIITFARCLTRVV